MSEAPPPVAGKVSVVLPVYRNLPYLPELHRRLGAVLAPLAPDYELVFVDDAGGDGSLEWLRAAAADDPHSRVVEMPSNVGQHRAVVEGLRVCDGDIAVVMDADLQDPPEEIPKLLAALQPGDAATMALRRDPYQSRARHYTGRLFKATLRQLFPAIPVGTSMFVAISADARDEVVRMAGERPYVPLLLAHASGRLRPVEIPKEPNPDNASGYTPMRRLVMGMRALRQAIVWKLHGPGR